MQRKIIKNAFLPFFLLTIPISLNAVVFTVTTTADNGDNIAPTPNSLRAAIVSNNLIVGPNEIDFNISGTPPFVIQPINDFPAITNTVLINGYSQPGSAPNTLTQGDNANLTIVLNGDVAGGDGFITGNGLRFGAGSNGSIVTGLVINGWLLNGILIDAGLGTIDNISILGNFIGLDDTGTEQVANRTGIGISGLVNPVTNTIIGSQDPAARNLFGGSFGPFIEDTFGLLGANIFALLDGGTTIQGNYFGVDRTGTLRLGNDVHNIVLAVSTNDTVGGTNPLQGNLISGANVYGIQLSSSTGTLIQNNFIGTDLTGSFEIGNSNAGIELDDSSNNIIAVNLISGNGAGIHIGQGSTLPGTNNTIQANMIGTNSTGTQAIPNTRFGIEICDPLTLVGGPTVDLSNLISGNTQGGILIFSLLGTETQVSGNKIGTDITGTQLLPNTGDGIQIGLLGGQGGGSNNLIGI